MNIIVCLDDSGGMMFHNRRQSRDAQLRADVIEYIAENTLRMNPYSAGQFSDSKNRIEISDDFLLAAETQDFCFVEDVDLLPFLDRIRDVIIYRWNRKYPADVFFPQQILAGKRLVEITQITGKSHKQITREVYEG